MAPPATEQVPLQSAWKYQTNERKSTNVPLGSLNLIISFVPIEVQIGRAHV